MNKFLIKSIDYIFGKLVEHIPKPKNVKKYTDTDLKAFLRDLKIRIFYDDDIKADINRLPEKEIIYLRELSKDGIVVTGSHVLRIYGLLDRPSGDVDVIHKLDIAKESGIIRNDNIVHGNSDDYDQKDDNVEKRIKVKHKKKKLDIFQIKKSIEIDGILHTHYYDTLKYKLSYKRDKDYVDFVNIKKKLGIGEDDYVNGDTIYGDADSYDFY